MNRSEINEMLGLTESELDELARPFEEGAWDAAAYGEPRFGRPLLFDEPTKPVTFKEAPSVIVRMDERAAALGMTRSQYLRGLVAADLASA